MKNKVDFTLLSSGDDETVEKTEKYVKVGEEDMERIFRRSQDKYRNPEKIISNEVHEDTVRGVEVRHNKRRHRYAAAASVLVVAAGVIGGGAYVISNFGGEDIYYISNCEVPEETTAEVTLPFERIGEDKLRMIAPPETAEFVEPKREYIQELDETLHKYNWTESSECDFSGDKFVTTVMYNNGNPYILVFFANGLVKYVNSQEDSCYRVSEEVYPIVRRIYEEAYKEETIYKFHNRSSLIEDVWDEENIHKKYAELQLHQDMLEFADEVEHWDFLKDKTSSYNFLEKTTCIDRTPYITSISSASSEEELNTIENKSYIYHMMLNSIDYFNTVKGEMHLNYFYDDNENTFIFQSDMMNGHSYEEDYSNSEYGLLHNTIYVYDNMFYNVIHNEKKYIKTEIDLNYGYDNVPDNYRVCRNNTEGYYLSYGRTEYTNLSRTASYIFPQDMAMSHLAEFDWWKITGIEQKCERYCAVIKGRTENIKTGGFDMDFEIYMDLETGIVMDYKSYDLSGNLYDSAYMTSLEIDIPLNRIEFDSEGYTEKENNF